MLLVIGAIQKRISLFTTRTWTTMELLHISQWSIVSRYVRDVMQHSIEGLCYVLNANLITKRLKVRSAHIAEVQKKGSDINKRKRN